MSTWRHLRAVALLPFMATAVVPAALLLITRSVRVGWGLPAALRLLPALGGGALIAMGLVLFGWTNRLFATTGRGTLAPWDPTQRLVVTGVYRHVRNPMISGVLCILLGEGIALGSPPLLAWAALFFGVNAVYIPLVEERGLEHRFGEDYRAYKRSVPRWIPSRTPWSASVAPASAPGLHS